MMHRILLWMAFVFLVSSCNQAIQKESGDQTVRSEKIIAATVEELVANPGEYQDKQVAISGKVTHICRHGGQECFVVGEDGETQIRIVPGSGIDEFRIDLEGSTVAFKGVLKVQTTLQSEAQIEDHESREHQTMEMAHPEAEKADVFIEATDFKEITE